MGNTSPRYQLLCYAMVTALVWSLTRQTAFAVVETTATTSLADGVPAAIIDGDKSTIWSSKQIGEQEIMVNLGRPWSIRSVEIEWGKNYPAEYELQLTVDGRIWTTVAHKADFIRPVSKAFWKFNFVAHKVDPVIVTCGLRIRCLKADNGVEIVDLRLNGHYPFCYEPVPFDAICLNKDANPEARVQDLLRRMTIREKIGMTGGFNFFFFSGLERFGFEPVLLSDATSGLNLRPQIGRDYVPSQSTSFPLAVALAATWEPELAYVMGKAIGEECRANGISVLLGPGVNIYRTSTCGRNFEYMGEDPYLASRMAVQHIKGVQSQKVIATIKHFIANNNEFVRLNCNAVIEERALHEIYLPTFTAAIKEANVRAIMSSYNWLNGEKCGESKTLLTDILRRELGYTGMVMSDWFDGTENMTHILESGQNMIMPDIKTFGQHVRTLLDKDPAGTEKSLDTMITPTLRILFETGTWDRPFIEPGFRDLLEGHKTVARTIAESAITLLKNDQVLPLTQSQKILITGDREAVESSSSGGGSGFVKGYDQINFYEGLKAVFGNAVAFDENPSDETVKAADRILYFFNMRDNEMADRPFELPGRINRQIQELAARNSNVIVVASTGTAFGAPWLNSVKGLVHGYYLGQEFGAAMANVLSGKADPSGKLPFTMEQSFADSPAYGYNLVNGTPWWTQKLPPNVTTKTIDVPYSEGVFVGYRWYEAKKKTVNFPFGFGLSYTTFKIHDLNVSDKFITKEKPISVNLTVKNTGKVSGAEVVQLYVHDERSSVERPYRELKGFKKVFLQPGESKVVTMTLDWKALAFWDVKTHAWLAEPGMFTLLVGNSSRDVQCRARIDYRNRRE